MTLLNFLDLMNADLRNEWTHLQFYLYHAGAVSGLHAEEYREFLFKAAMGELDHILQFTQRLFGLNYKQPVSVGGLFPQFTDVPDILAHAVALENEVVNIYAQRLKEIDSFAEAHPTTAAYLRIFYEKQLEDSYEDCEKMRRLLIEK